MVVKTEKRVDEYLQELAILEKRWIEALGSSE